RSHLLTGKRDPTASIWTLPSLAIGTGRNISRSKPLRMTEHSFGTKKLLDFFALSAATQLLKTCVRGQRAHRRPNSGPEASFTRPKSLRTPPIAMLLLLNVPQKAGKFV